MKKILVCFASAILMTSVFAKGNYSGDVQVQLGFSSNSAAWKAGEILGQNVEAKMKSNEFVGGIATYQMYALNDIISLGGNLSFNGYYGVINSTELKAAGMKLPLGTASNTEAIGLVFNLGPAVGFNLGKAIRLSVAGGLSLSFLNLYGYYAQSSIDTELSLVSNDCLVGFYADVQGKFFPNFFISPIIGYRFSIYGGESSWRIKTNIAGGGFNQARIIDKSIISNDIYVGASINW